MWYLILYPFIPLGINDPIIQLLRSRSPHRGPLRTSLLESKVPRDHLFPKQGGRSFSSWSTPGCPHYKTLTSFIIPTCACVLMMSAAAQPNGTAMRTANAKKIRATPISKDAKEELHCYFPATNLPLNYCLPLGKIRLRPQQNSAKE